MDGLFPGESLFNEADPITVRVRGVMILENEDQDEWFSKKKNDVLITTTYQFGAEPPVQRLHFMQDDAELGWQGPFFNDIVFSKRDYNPKVDHTLTLRIQVYDIDKIPQELINGVRDMMSSAAVAFPAIAIYAGAVGFAAPILLKLLDNLNEHDSIIDGKIQLEREEEFTGHKLLQPSYCVVFRNPVDEGFFLDKNLRIVDGDDKDFRECSYAVLDVQRKYKEPKGWEIDKKVAKLLEELGGKGKSGETPLHFLRETLDAYTKFQKLKRAIELHNEEDLKGPKKTLYDELLADEELKKFLPL
ncbi:hypothetical protein GWO25_00515 [Candidatus Saccharibacteria bacterium]|nr:hypothetical protein [Candidatus Saccharibacteria bacterium]